jgi:hypothetical protein
VHEHGAGYILKAAEPEEPAGGFHHLEKGNLHGARTKLAAGIERLRACEPAVLGVRVDRWLAVLQPWLARVEKGESAGVLDVAAIPGIPLVRRGGF